MTRRPIPPVTFHRITLASLLALIAIVVTGAAVRLTGSGLGCTDWPHCNQSQLVPAADGHAWVEFGNRLITGFVSLAVIAAVLGSRWRMPPRLDLVLLAWGLVIGVLAQIVVGALVVSEHLPPELVITHFLISMVLVANAVVLHHQSGLPDEPATTPAPAPASVVRPLWMRPLAWCVGGVAVVGLATGTVVTGAGPHAGDEGVERLAVDVPGAARVHGIAAMVLLGLVVGLAMLVVRSRSTDLQRPVGTLLLVVLAQAAVGYTQYFTDVPALLVGIHVLGATTLWAAVVWTALQVHRPAPALLSPEPEIPALRTVDATRDQGFRWVGR